jgi:P27 family predicted phage terminase small subunit
MEGLTIMGARGRKPANHMMIAEKKRPKPPKRLGRIGKAMWREIIGSYPPDHFRRSELFLLEKYCICEEIYWEAMDKVTECGLITTTETGYQVQNTYLSIANTQVKLQATLSTKLRIATNSRISASKAGHEKEPIVNNSRRDMLYDGKIRRGLTVWDRDKED